MGNSSGNLADYTIEVVHSSEHAVRSARVFPPVAARAATRSADGDEQTSD